jgi:hypothetical protein
MIQYYCYNTALSAADAVQQQGFYFPVQMAASKIKLYKKKPSIKSQTHCLKETYCTEF